MRVAAVLLMVLCLAAVGLTGYLYLNANMVITGIDCIAADAAGSGEFEAVREQLDSGTFAGTPFENGGLGPAEDYQFYTYTVRLQNGTFVRAEVAEVQVSPMQGDVLQLSGGNVKSLPARSRGSLQATILTRKGNHNVRELMITYYLWGLPFFVRTTYSA